VKNELARDGFQEIKTADELTGKTYLIDDEFYDVILFPRELLTFIERYSLVSQGILIIQVSSNHPLF